MVNVYDLDRTESTDLARNQAVINSCMAINSTLTPADIRRNIDIAFVIAKSHQEKINVKNKIKEPEPVRTSDHQPCNECGGIFFLRTGTCHVCQTCGKSQGCS